MLLEGLQQEEPVFDGGDGVHQRASTPTGVHDVDVAVRADGSHAPFRQEPRDDVARRLLIHADRLVICPEHDRGVYG